MHLHLAPRRRAVLADAPPLIRRAISRHGHLLTRRSRPAFRLNCTLNEINEILVAAGGMGREASLAGLLRVKKKKKEMRVIKQSSDRGRFRSSCVWKKAREE